VTGNTYGTWLPGEWRGWRTRHGRHQPGADRATREDGERLHAWSRKQMKRRPVTLSVKARTLALGVFVAALRDRGIEVVACSIDDHHCHTLARFTDRRPRKWVGIAKMASALALSRAGLAKAGGVWAVRCHCRPMADRNQQVEIAKYIKKHERTGAAVWWIRRDGGPEKTV
jgi:hypothetical protein